MHAVNACFYHFINEALLIFGAFSHQQIEVSLISGRIMKLDSGEKLIDCYSKGVYNSDDRLKTRFALCILDMAYVGDGEFRFLCKPRL